MFLPSCLWSSNKRHFSLHGLSSLSLHRWNSFITHQASRFFVIPSLSPSLPIHPHPSLKLFHTKPLSSPLSITLSSLQTEILKGFWVWVEIKIKVSQTHNKKWIATVASKWTLAATMVFFKPSTQNTKPIFKEPIFFKPKTHAHEHYHQSHPWLDPLSSVYVWIDGNDSDYFWVIWWICFFFFFFFWKKSWLGCWWLNNGFWCGGACCWWWCGWEREREREAVRKGDRN